MTPTESAALDAAVARALGTNVLGEALCSPWRDGSSAWHVERSQARGVLRPVYLGECHCRDDDGGLYGVRVFGHCWLCLEVVPCYSAEIAAAWEVIRSLTPPRNTWRFQLFSSHQCANPAHHWVCDLALGEDGWTGTGVEAPEAIARAVLKALTGEGQP